MSTLLESYRILGVKVGADMAAVTTSYKQLCREYHPDISDSPDAEEMMKQVNVAYTMLREKFRREAAFYNRAATMTRQTANRPVRRYPQERPPAEQAKTSQAAADLHKQANEEYRRKAAQQATVSAEAETDSRKVLHSYFKALNTFDYEKAYELLSEHDKSRITLESFTRWREAVSKLYPMREFKIAAHSSIAVVTWGGNKIFHARKFKVIVTEENYKSGTEHSSGEHDKLVIIENDNWRVFLGYKEVSELTKTFEQRFETKKKKDIDRRWEEYTAGIDTEHDMFTMAGLRKLAAKEIYRQRRYGAAITFAAISIVPGEGKSSAQNELIRTAARTVKGQLRELDICAYAGDGVFVILFVELGRRNAKSVITRLVEMIRHSIDPDPGENVKIEYCFDSWSENRYADAGQINDILAKFGKKF